MMFNVVMSYINLKFRGGGVGEEQGGLHYLEPPLHSFFCCCFLVIVGFLLPDVSVLFGICVNKPSTALEEKKAMFLVSKGLELVHILERG